MTPKQRKFCDEYIKQETPRSRLLMQGIVRKQHTKSVLKTSENLRLKNTLANEWNSSLLSVL